MSLSITLEEQRWDDVWDGNITNNLGAMAAAVSDRFYRVVWRPEELGLKVAGDLIPDLRIGLAELVDNREEFEQHNPENGWGSYESFIPWLRAYLAACEDNPQARLRISR